MIYEMIVASVLAGVGEQLLRDWGTPAWLHISIVALWFAFLVTWMSWRGMLLSYNGASGVRTWLRMLLLPWKGGVPR